MATTDTVCFGDADGVTGIPQINGMVDYDYLTFDPADPFETGYVKGSRITYEGGALASAMFQGVRYSGTRLAFGFFARLDNRFDEDDMIILALRQSPASGPAKLVLIKPNLDNVGAEPGVGTGANEVKRNVTPPAIRIDYWESATGAAPWTPIADPAGVEVKLRSWKPMRPDGAPEEVAWSVEVSWPLALAGFPLGDDFGLYYNIVRLMHDAGNVQSPFPIGAEATSDPGPSFVVPAWGHGLIPALQTPAGSNLGLGVRFKDGVLGVGRRPAGSSTTSLTGTIEGPGGASDNEIVALVENTGETAANDIRAEFHFANWGLPAATFPAWDFAQGMEANPAPKLTGTPPLDPPVNLAGTPNPAAPTTGTIASDWLRINVPTQYSSHKHQCIWVQLDSGTGVNFAQSSMRRNMDFDHFSEIEREAEVSGEGYPEPADGSGDHDFVIETFCRQINVSEFIGGREKDPATGALLAGVIQQQPQQFNDDNALAARTFSRNAASQYKNTAVLVWIAQGFRRTGKFMTIKGKPSEILDATPGQFGIAAAHEGLTDKFSYAFAGDGLVQHAPGVYGLKVPHKGKKTIKLKLGMSADGPAGDRSDLPRKPFPKPGQGSTDDLPGGCLAQLMRLLGGK
jgi:hypothetical protein